MRLARFTPTGHQTPRPGIVTGTEITDLSAAASSAGGVHELLSVPTDTLHRSLTHAPRYDLTDVRLHPPVPTPQKFFAIGLNSHSHRRELTRAARTDRQLLRMGAGYRLAHPHPELPWAAAKAVTAISGPHDPIIHPPAVTTLDYEGELAVVLARDLHAANDATAAAAIGGYLITNDLTVHEWHDNPVAIGLAKSYPSHGPTGPWLTTPDDIDFDRLTLHTTVNGHIRQHAHLAADLRASPVELIARLSHYCALTAGDIIACGTPAGTGRATHRYLQPGDTITVAIDDLGAITNTVTQPPTTTPESSNGSPRPARGSPCSPPLSD
ncbi:fumarylacetoacetate hydrolase family protein [Nocardia sp. CA2R105]|uniref:fumarylacetoacetate hydrolase family protein n=1 Tax=Nocardia coffeae TaxID=2873381 RepID=UPI001CA6449E|nr:fumarylacetoacetate hydrolase family protein [Nocardia coffeae]MBY8863906.1 fumarylacetoacetate hydrolase family protein [Nocardia coffeae]